MIEFVTKNSNNFGTLEARLPGENKSVLTIEHQHVEHLGKVLGAILQAIQKAPGEDGYRSHWSYEKEGSVTVIPVSILHHCVFDIKLSEDSCLKTLN